MIRRAATPAAPAVVSWSPATHHDPGAEALVHPVVSAGRLFAGSVAIAAVVGAVLGPLWLADLEPAARAFLGGVGGLVVGGVIGALAGTAGLLAARLAGHAGLSACRWAFTGVGSTTALALAWASRVPADPLETTVTMVALAAVTLLAGRCLAWRLIVARVPAPTR